MRTKDKNVPYTGVDLSSKSDISINVREISDGIYWINETHSRPDQTDFYDKNPPDWYPVGSTIYSQFNAYLINGDKSLLFDTLTPISADNIKQILDEYLEEPLDYLVVSHPEGPHAGNALKLLEKYPELQLIAPDKGEKHELYHLDTAELADEGDQIDLGGLRVEFVEASFPDHGLHIWMRELTTDTLFCVDWMGMRCLEEERLKFVDETDIGSTEGRKYAFHGLVLFWLQYVYPELVNEEIDKIKEDINPSMLAPAHGLPIRKNIDKHADQMKSITKQIIETGRLKMKQDFD